MLFPVILSFADVFYGKHAIINVYMLTTHQVRRCSLGRRWGA